MGRNRRQGRGTPGGERGARGPLSTGSPPRHVWIDGRLAPADEPHVSAFDRGFQLGDGVFETLRARAGRVTEIDEHVARLRTSADGLGIVLPDDVGSLVSAGVPDLLAAQDLAGSTGDAAIRIPVTRGAFRGRGLLPSDEDVRPTIAIQAWPVLPPPAGPPHHGTALVASAVRRDPADPLAALKTISRAEYVFARLEARRAGADDAVFLTLDGHLSEATTANVFVVRRATDGAEELATPALDCAILPGTTRSWLISWADRGGLRPSETRLRPDDLATAAEAFLSSSVAGILPVTRWEGHPIGDGGPGHWTRRGRGDPETTI